MQLRSFCSVLVGVGSLMLAGCGSAKHPIPCSGTSLACVEQRFVAATTNANEVLLFPVEQNGALGAPSPLLPGPSVPAGIAVSPPSRELFVADHAGETLFAFVQSGNTYTSAPGSPYSLGSSEGFLESVTATSDGKFVYVVGLDGGIFGFSIGANGVLTPIPGSPFQAGVTQSVASVTDSAGKFLFVVNDSSVSSFFISPTDGTLTVAAPPFPLPSTTLPTIGMVATTSANFLYVALSSVNGVAGFSFDPNTGGLTGLGGSPFPVGKVPFTLTTTANTLYVVNSGDGTISALSWNSTTGALTEISGSPFSAPSGGGELAVLNGQFLYVPSINHVFPPNVNAILGFSISPSGALTPLVGSPFTSTAQIAGGLAAF
jgi:hypothetical protein